MNLRVVADARLSLAIRKNDGSPLARTKNDPRKLHGEAFRVPQWIDERSARRLTDFAAQVWADALASGLDDPVRVARGLAPMLSAADRRVIERRAMEVVHHHYASRGYACEDVSANNPYDLRATRGESDEVHVEVKGTTGDGRAVTVTAGERKHAREFARAALAIVSRIVLTRGRSPNATGGTLRLLDPWSRASGRYTPTVYRYEPPSGPSRRRHR